MRCKVIVPVRLLKLVWYGVVCGRVFLLCGKKMLGLLLFLESFILVNFPNSEFFLNSGIE